MSSDWVHAQGLIRNEPPIAVVTAQILLLPARVVFLWSATCWTRWNLVNFFIKSPIWECLLMEVALPPPKKKVIQWVSGMCWLMYVVHGGQLVMLHATISIQAYIFIVKPLEVIVYDMHADDYTEDVTTCWEGKCKAEASGLLTRIKQIEFIITFLTVYQLLSHLEGITVKLQSTSLDIIQAFHLVEEVKVVYKDLREIADRDFSKIYDHSLRDAEKVEVQPAKPRMAGRMKNRANALLIM